MDLSADSDEWVAPPAVFKFPCAAGLKVPALLGSWREHATAEVVQHAVWVAEGYNLAVDCERSGWAVLDVDGGEIGEASLAALEAAHGPLPPTREHRTRSGGRHLIFYGLIPSTVGRLGLKLDTRSRGGYVLIPPSEVGWAPYSLLHDRPIAPLPDWVGEVLARHVEPTPASGATGAPISLDGLREVLSYLDPECSRDDWRDVVAAIRAAPVPNDDDAVARRDLSHAWSEGQLDRKRRYAAAPPYAYDHRSGAPLSEDEASTAVDEVFDTMPPKPDGVGVGSLVVRARAAGFNRPLDAGDLTKRFADVSLSTPAQAAAFPRPKSAAELVAGHFPRVDYLWEKFILRRFTSICSMATAARARPCWLNTSRLRSRPALSCSG